VLEPLITAPRDGLEAATRLGIAGLLGLAVGIERQWSGHASGPAARFAGLRTFLILGIGGGLAGILSAVDRPVESTVLLGGCVALVIAAFVVTMRRPEAEVDGTTEAAALVVLGLALVAGMGQLALASGAVAVVVLALGEKQRLHGLVAKVGAPELQAAARFAVMALVILPVLPTTPLPFGGDISPRSLWILVLLFSAINFAGYLAREAVGANRGYGITGVLGGLISSTLITLQFSRKSREEPQHAAALALGTVAACTVLPARIIGVLMVLSATVAEAALPFLVPPVLVGAIILLLAFRRRHEGGGGEAKVEAEKSPLRVVASIRMALLFWVALVAIGYVQARFGSAGVYSSAVLLGLTDMDALTVAMARLGATGDRATLAATGIAIGLLSNTVFKLTLGLVLGSAGYRRWLLIGLGALGGAVGVGWVL
jgi:uncharacterized membrane protein (DUF4010 family)